MKMFGKRRRIEERPTTTFYFTAAMRGLIGAPGDHSKPVWSLNANVLACPSNEPSLVVLRSLDGLSFAKIRRILGTRPASIHYLIDDDLEAGSVDPAFSAEYRKKLAALLREQRNLLALATCCHVPSPVLRDRLKGRAKAIDIIAPASPANLRSPKDLDRREGSKWRILYSGTPSHAEDVARIAPGLARFLRHHPEAHLTTFCGRDSPELLRSGNVDHRPAIDWHGYRQFLQTSEFDVLLAPANATPFNASRSTTKLIEAAMVGAAPVVSANLPWAFRVSRDGRGVVPVSEDDWYDELTSLFDDRERCRRLAHENMRAVRMTGSIDCQRAYWKRHLDL